MGWRESLFDKRKNIFPNVLKAHRCVDERLFSSPIRAGEWGALLVPREAGSRGSPGGSKASGYRARRAARTLIPVKPGKLRALPWCPGDAGPLPARGWQPRAPPAANLPPRKPRSTTRLAKRGHALCCCNGTDSTRQSRLIKTSCWRRRLPVTCQLMHCLADSQAPRPQSLPAINLSIPEDRAPQSPSAGLPPRCHFWYQEASLDFWLEGDEAFVHPGTEPGGADRSSGAPSAGMEVEETAALGVPKQRFFHASVKAQ